MPRKIRLDLHLLTKGLAASRQQAQNLIRAGKVRDSHGRLLEKPGHEVSEDIELQIKKTPRFVSRGGEKLFAALKEFAIPVKGRVCLDAGISTGGFTDCLLQNGASRVYGIDVGYGQIAWSLRIDSRVVLKERTNIRNLTSENLYGPQDPLPNLAVADLSFISLTLVLPVLKSLLRAEDHELILLIKPQFEVGRERVGKGGVVRDLKGQVDALTRVITCSKSHGWKLKGLLPSPLTGPAGNHEYLLWLGLTGLEVEPDLSQMVKDTLN